MRAAAVILAMALCAPASAAVPPVGSEDWLVLHPHAEWIRNLRNNGRDCCDWSDTRPVKYRTVADRYQIWLRKDQIIGAPIEQWIDVPEDAVMRIANPIGVAVASWYGGRVQCFVPAGGI